MRPAHERQTHRKVGDVREVLIHLNVSVADDLSDSDAETRAVTIVVNAARESRQDFEELIALVDPQ